MRLKEVEVMIELRKIYRAARYSQINLDIALYCLNIQDNNRYNIYMLISIQCQYCDVKNLVLSYENNLTFSNRNNLSK